MYVCTYVLKKFKKFHKMKDVDLRAAEADTETETA